MEILNLMLSIFGFAGWFYIWCRRCYKTGRTLRTQLGVMLLGVMWLLLFLADTAQALAPTSFTVSARIVVIIALWCLMPLLHDKDKT